MTDQNKLTYDDFQQRINIRDLLVDVGYRFNRRDGIRYPSYVRIGEDGKRVRGDKFIVTATGTCCFRPPERKNYNVISFIKSFPQLFREYAPGISTDRLVNMVCNRLLNNPVPQEWKADKIEPADRQPFDISQYKCHSFKHDDFSSQKPFYPYFKTRGIDLKTQDAFSDYFFLATKNRSDGKKYTNLAFPMFLASNPGGAIVGLEERGRPKADGTATYKGMAINSNASEGVWIAQPGQSSEDKGIKLNEAKDIYWFESAYDAMAFYQLEKRDNKDNTKPGDSIFVSTGGSPSKRQLSSMIDAAPNATHHLCFDRDKAGQMFAINFALQKAKREYSSYLSIDKSSLIVNSQTGDFKRYEIPLLPFEFKDICSKLNISNEGLDYHPCNSRYKDWNDQLLDKPIKTEENNGMRR